jgi:hypothetical protein
MDLQGRKEKPSLLADLFLRLLGGCILDYDLGPDNLRLMVACPAAPLLAPGQEAIQVVLEDCRELFYLSYTQSQEERVVQQDVSTILSQDLLILGCEEKTGNQLILFCSSSQNLLEAGELHLAARCFHLYDQEYGHLSYERFCRAADRYAGFST